MSLTFIEDLHKKNHRGSYCMNPIKMPQLDLVFHSAESLPWKKNKQLLFVGCFLRSLSQ